MKTALLLILAASLAGCAGFYTRADLSSQVSGNMHYWCNGSPCQGPHGQLAVGYEWTVSDSLLLRGELQHRSFPQDNDRGEELVSCGFEWRPWSAR